MVLGLASYVAFKGLPEDRVIDDVIPFLSLSFFFVDP